MEIIGSREFDPEELEIDEDNERVSNVGFNTEKDDALVSSIEENGVITPIVVRKKNGQHFVVAGQRRTLAAREADVDSIPARVYRMDDREAQLMSITENADQYDKDVLPADRADAIDSLLEDGMSIDEIANQMGVSKPTVERWWEPARDYWVDTEFESNSDDSDSLLDDISLTAMRMIRENTSSPEQSERIAKKIINHNVKVKFVRDAKEAADSPEEFEDEIDRTIRNLRQGIQQIREEVGFTGEEAEQLEEIMRNRGIGEKKAIEMLVEERLDQLKSANDGRLLLIYLPEKVAKSVEQVTSGTDVPVESLCRQIIKKQLEDTEYL